MRKKLHQQLPIMQGPIDHPHAAELWVISGILDARPEFLDIVKEDLLDGGIDPHVGREAMTAEQVLRALVIKQMNGFSYEQLAFHLADSRTYRSFCRIGEFERVPKKSTLQENIKRLKPDSLERINRVLIGMAKHYGVENGRKARVDCTVTETNILKPSDSSLLWDSVRVLTLLMRHLSKECLGIVEIEFSDHRRRAKRRALAIKNARSKKKRRKLFKDLLKVTRWTVEYAERTARDVLDSSDELSRRALDFLFELRRFIYLAGRVIDQAHRRVIMGEKVPSQDKLVSIFEAHTDIIVKSNRETEFGHKLCLSTGKSSLVLDCTIEDGNPSDATLATQMVERHKEIYGRVPRQVAFDGSFASNKNLREIKGLGVKDVSFQKRRGISVSDMVKSSWVYKQLKRFRAGVEGVISWLKRCFGLDRCLWRGYESFKSYVWSSIVSANLLVMARHLLE